MNQRENHKVIISASIDPDVWKAFKTLSENKGRSMSSMIEEYIRELVESKE